MGKISKNLALFMMLTIAMSCLTLLMVKPATAQTGVTQPVVPRFDPFLNTHPEYIPPTYGVDPSTGKAVIIQAGYEVVNKWVGVRVWGQPFWEYNNAAGQRVLLYYHVRWQSNLDTAWQSFPSEVKYYHDSMDPWDTEGEGCIISIGFKGIEGVGMQLIDPNAETIDFQVEALIGYYDSNDNFVGQTSGWSNTQTITIPASDSSSSSSSSSPTSTPGQTTETTPNQTTGSNSQDTTQTWQSVSVLGATVGVVVVIAGLLAYFKKRKRLSESK